MLPVVAALGCFGYTAKLALRTTGFDRVMFTAIAGLHVVLFFVVVLS